VTDPIYKGKLRKVVKVEKPSLQMPEILDSVRQDNTITDMINNKISEAVGQMPSGMIHQGGAGFHVGDLPGYKQASTGEYFRIQADGTVGFSAGTGGGTEVSDDLTPQLGGNLDGQGFDITNVGQITVGDDGIIAATNTEGHIWVSDGTNFNSVLMSGEAEIAADGTVTLLGGDAVSVVQDAKVNEVGGIGIGQLVYISGATGGFPQVTLADNSDYTKTDTIGIANETKSDGQTIRVTLLGEVTGLDTSAFTEGQIVYLGTSGGMTATHPSGINAVVRVGKAVKINASTGSIIFNVDSLSAVNDHDGIVRHQVVNQNAGTSASTSYTMVNDASERSSISMVGSNYTAVAGIASSFVLYNEGYNKTVNAVDGNFGFEWWTDVTDSHNLSATSKMDLSAAGVLSVGKCVQIGTAPSTLDTLDVDGSLFLQHTATETDDHAQEIEVHAAGFGDVKALDIDYVTGAINTGQDEAIILINIDETLAVGGDVSGLEVISTAGGADKVTGLFTGIGVGPVEQLSGAFGDADDIDVNGSDETTALANGGAGNIAAFTADNDYVIIGEASKFEEIEFILDTVASGAGISPTFEFSTGSGTWDTFTPIDGTNGCRNTGVIVWLDSDIPTWATGTSGDYLIRITRTRNSLGTTPILDEVQIAANSIEYFWDKDGNVEINNMTANGVVMMPGLPTSDPSNAGQLWNNSGVLTVSAG